MTKKWIVFSWTMRTMFFVKKRCHLLLPVKYRRIFALASEMEHKNTRKLGD